VATATQSPSDRGKGSAVGESQIISFVAEAPAFRQGLK
jgi:hypothetical protein